jgi:hypothetical protein
LLSGTYRQFLFVVVILGSLYIGVYVQGNAPGYKLVPEVRFGKPS